MQRFASSLGVLVLIAACKSASPTPNAATPPDGEGTTHAAPGAVLSTWAEAEAADTNAQVAYMKSKVVPAMKPKFAAGESEEFGCATCHGPDNQNPHEFLPHLTMANGQITEFASMPDVSKYMAETIVPAMADAMGEAPFDPATGQGFGCGGCHTIDPG